jgi:hypothetical protein
MALMVFGIVLHRNGWRIGYLGVSTPVEELERAVDASHPGPLALAGAGATAQTATAGARLIAGDPVTEAERAGWSG